jgi:hypothetical protein
VTTILFYFFAILTVVAGRGVIAARAHLLGDVAGRDLLLSGGIYALLLAHTIAVLQSWSTPGRSWCCSSS